MNYCPKCNKYVEDDTLRFCEDCGTPYIRLKSAQKETVGVSNQNPENIVKEGYEDEPADNVAALPVEAVETNVQPEVKSEVIVHENVSVNQVDIAVESAPQKMQQDASCLKDAIPAEPLLISENKKFGIGLAAGVAIALILGGAFFFLNSNGKNDDTVNITVKQVETSEKKQEQPKIPVPKKPKVVPKTNLDLAKEYLAQKGYDDSYVTATTYGLSNKGFLCYGNKMITVVDTKNNQIAYLLNTDEVISQYKLFRKNNDNSPLVLKFFLGKEARDKDAGSGYWENGNHYLPIYSLYNFKSDGSMEHGGLYTGEGRNISHYHKYLYEMKNVDIADIVLTQLVKLGPQVLNEFPMAKEPYRDVKPEQKKQNNTNVNINSNMSARNAFIGFHQAITNKQLKTAFTILSPDYQKFMQSYDHFAKGYTTTLRSDVIDLKVLHEDSYSAIYAYTLKAVDRDGNGQKVQYFAGKVKLIRINGDWRIESTEAKRL